MSFMDPSVLRTMNREVPTVKRSTILFATINPRPISTAFKDDNIGGGLGIQLSDLIPSVRSMSRGAATISSSHTITLPSYEGYASSFALRATVEHDETIQTITARSPKSFAPYPFQYHEILTLKVETLTNLGIGICRAQLEVPNTSESLSEETIQPGNELENNNRKSTGWVIMVPNVIPGEIIQCQIYRNNKSYSDANLLHILERSPNRTQPKCSLSTICGGCQYQHMDITSQREWKTSQVQESFERIGNLDPASFPQTSDTLGTDEIYNYRTKITPHYDEQVTGRKRKKSKGGGVVEIRAIGFKKKTNRQLVDVQNCHIATDAINAKLAQVREEKFRQSREGRLKKSKKGTTMLLRDAFEEKVKGRGGDNETRAVVETNPSVYVTAGVKGLTFRFMAGNFFQNNPFLLPVMVEHVVDAAIQLNRNRKKMTHLIDCYCGSGLFCLSSSTHFDVCVGIEVNEKAVEEARVNAQLNNIRNCKFVAASAEAIFESQDPVTSTPLLPVSHDGSSRTTIDILVDDFPRETTTVIIDPPRKGCSPDFLEQLFKFAPERVVYMSCDPATQARDSNGIVAAGYRIVCVQPFDLFPQTRHIECLVTFDKN